MYRCAFGTVRALVAIRNAGLNIATVYASREKTVVVKLANAMERRGRFLAIIEPQNGLEMRSEKFAFRLA